MEPIVFAIGVGVGVAMAAVWARRALDGGAGRIQQVLLRSEADRRGGELVMLGLGVTRGLELPLDTPGVQRIRVGFERSPSGSSPERMRLELRLQRVFPHLRLSPEGLLADLGKAIGVQDMASGDDDLDRRFLIAADDPPLARELLRPPVVRALFRLFRGQPGTLVWLELEPDSLAGFSDLVIHSSGWVTNHEDLRDLMGAAEQLAEVLVRAWDTPWLEAAHARGLAVGKLGQRGSSTLVGVLDGIPVEARARRTPSGWRTEVTAWVDTLPGLLVVHSELAEEQGWADERVSLGNPVLDMLVAAKADDSAALRALLTPQAVTDELLPVVHGRPGSSLRHDSVRLVERGRLTEGLGAAIDDTLALAQAARTATGQSA
jgi:hypothetical protein